MPAISGQQILGGDRLDGRQGAAGGSRPVRRPWRPRRTRAGRSPPESTARPSRRIAVSSATVSPRSGLSAARPGGGSLDDHDPRPVGLGGDQLEQRAEAGQDPIRPGRLGRRGGHDPRPRLGGDPVVEAEEAVLLAREQRVEGADADPRRGDDVVDRGRLVAARGEDPGGGGKHAVALVLFDDLSREARFADGGRHQVIWKRRHSGRITRVRIPYQKGENAVSN